MSIGIPEQVIIEGVDILFDGDLHTDLHGDYQEVQSMDNLRLSILRRLMTNPGEYMYRPNYGCGLKQQVKKPMTQSNINYLKNLIRENLQEEDRIDTVDEISIEPIYPNNNPILNPQSNAMKVTVKVTAFGRTVTIPTTIAR